MALPGWLNTDISGVAEYLLDAAKPWPMAVGSVSHVFADNVLEHLTIDKGRYLLRAANRVMRPGGIIRLVVPDVGANAQAYVEHGQALLDLLDRARRNGYSVEHDVDVFRVIFMVNGHHEGYMYDEDALRTELERAGFTGVRRWSPGQSADPVLQGIDARTEPIDAVLLLTVEAVRP